MRHLNREVTVTVELGKRTNSFDYRFGSILSVDLKDEKLNKREMQERTLELLRNDRYYGAAYDFSYKGDKAADNQFRIWIQSKKKV